MSLLYAGGLWTIAVIYALICGYIWALNGPRWGYKAALVGAILVIIGSQVLSPNHLFNISVGEGLQWWRWAITISIPVLIYAMGIRWLKKKASARYDA